MLASVAGLVIILHSQTHTNTHTHTHTPPHTQTHTNRKLVGNQKISLWQADKLYSETKLIVMMSTCGRYWNIMKDSGKSESFTVCGCVFISVYAHCVC